MAFDSAQNLINDAAVWAGLGRSANVYASVDPNFLQLQVLLKDLGQEIRQERQWTRLQRVFTFQTVANQSRYTKPFDFGEFINQTAWNRTSRLPMAGPLSAQQYEFYKSMLVGVVFQTLWRDTQGTFQVYPDASTPGGFVIAYEYLSNSWVIPAGASATSGTWQVTTSYPNGTLIEHGGRIYVATQGGTGISGLFGPSGVSAVQPLWVANTSYGYGAAVSNGGNVYVCVVPGKSDVAPATGPAGTGSYILDGTIRWAFTATVTSPIVDGTCTWTYVGASGIEVPLANDDIIQFDAKLVRRGLRYRWKLEKGLATAQDRADYDEALEVAKGADAAANVLYLDRTYRSDYLLSARNIPLTGFANPTGP